MHKASSYRLRHEVITGKSVTVFPQILFKTGKPTVPLPAVSVLLTPNLKTSLGEGIVLHTYVPETLKIPTFPVAVDLHGDVVWYFPNVVGWGYVTRPLPGGNLLFIGDGPGSVYPSQKYQILKEIDLAGNTIRITNAARLSEQLLARGQQSIGAFNHEAIRLTNGHTLVLATTERIYTDGTQGSSIGNPVDVLGEMVVDLDQNFQVVWNWNAFDHLDVNRAAILGETCNNADGACPPLFLASTANDWLHTNSIDYIPSDGNLLVSIRHQDWIVKIDYANGTGSGNVIWRLGNAGDFQISSTDPHPWFSHQHDAGYALGGTQILSVFDNGNTRQASDPTAHSRGQILNINEAQRQATLTLNVDLGIFSVAWGSAQMLENGNYHFLPGYAGANTSQSIEVLPSGTFNYQLQSAAGSYRSFRMQTLYAP